MAAVQLSKFKKDNRMLGKNLLTMIFLAFVLVSCEYEANEYYIIDNKSSYDINVAFVKRYSTNKDTTKLVVGPNETRNFFTRTTATSVSMEIGDNYLEVFDTICISINDTLTLEKDFYNMDNWDYWHQGKRDSEGKFTFTINNTDLKNKTE